jgi:hypothetical protein
MKYLYFLLVFPLLLLSLEPIEKEMLPYAQFDKKQAISLLPKSFNKLREKLNTPNKEEVFTILYFFSASVPESSFSKRLSELAEYNYLFEKNINATECLVGINSTLKTYLSKVQKNIHGLRREKEILNLINIRMTPEVYENLKLKNVPALALAQCVKGEHPSKCKILSLARGDISLNYFFDQLKDANLFPEGLK